MTFFQAIILGIVQGLTEFLPISSSGHLVIIPFLFRWALPADQVFPFGVLVQLGTLLAVIIYFRKDLWNILRAFFFGIFHRKPFADPQARFGWYLILATIPAGIFGVLLKSKVEAVFQSVSWTAIFLLVTALFLFIAEKVGKRNRNLSEMNWKDSLWIGAWQAVSIFPGISRSGATMTGGLTRNYDRTSAARFSFLMSIPIMLAAGVLSVKDLLKVSNLTSFLPKLAVGFIIAAIVGYFSIHFFLKLIAKHSLLWFAFYCVVVGIIVLILSFVLPPLAQPASAAAQSQPLQVQSSASLRWLSPKLNNCAQQVDSISLSLQENPQANLADNNSIYLQWGSQVPANKFAAQISSDQLVIIVNPANGLRSLTLSEVQALFGGSQAAWSDGSPVHIFIFSPADDLGQFFSSVIMRSTPISSFAQVVYDPQSMLKAIAQDPLAIGVSTFHSIDSSVSVVSISDVSTADLTQPIIIILPTEPIGSLKSWVICLQAG
jgi:undecaprenyl-diphosphatase